MEYIFDREQMLEKTRKDTVWLHFGAGEVFKKHIADAQRKLLENGVCQKGIIVCEPDGNIDESVRNLTCVAECIEGFENTGAASRRLRKIFEQKWLQMVSFTIVDAEYDVLDENGDVCEAIKRDIAENDLSPVTMWGKLARMLLYRYEEGGQPLSILSMDDIKDADSIIRKVIYAYADGWTANDLVEPEFAGYVERDTMIAFPKTTVVKDKNNWSIKIEDVFPNKREDYHKGEFVFCSQF